MHLLRKVWNERGRRKKAQPPPRRRKRRRLRTRLIVWTARHILTRGSCRRLTRAPIAVSFSAKVSITVHRFRLIPLLVISSLLVTSIVYACSGLALAQLTTMSATMDHSATEGKPCNGHKQDICKSVRYQMLSVRPSLVVSEITIYLSATLYSVQYDVPLSTSLIRGVGPPGIIFPSASEVSFPFSTQVLRI